MHTPTKSHPHFLNFSKFKIDNKILTFGSILLFLCTLNVILSFLKECSLSFVFFILFFGKKKIFFKKKGQVLWSVMVLKPVETGKAETIGYGKWGKWEEGDRMGCDRRRRRQHHVYDSDIPTRLLPHMTCFLSSSVAWDCCVPHAGFPRSCPFSLSIFNFSSVGLMLSFFFSLSFFSFSYLVEYYVCTPYNICLP